MNAEVAYAYRERRAHAEAMDEVAHRLHCLQHLKLKTVIKVGNAAGRFSQPAMIRWSGHAALNCVL